MYLYPCLEILFLWLTYSWRPKLQILDFFCPIFSFQLFLESRQNLCSDIVTSSLLVFPLLDISLYFCLFLLLSLLLSDGWLSVCLIRLICLICHSFIFLFGFFFFSFAFAHLCLPPLRFSVCLSVCLWFCLYGCLCICMFECLSVCPLNWYSYQKKMCLFFAWL